MIAAFTQVWTALCTWFTTLFPAVTEFFYDTTADTEFFYDTTAEELTFAGTCAVIMAGVSLILLVFNLIRSFLPMRG